MKSGPKPQIRSPFPHLPHDVRGQPQARAFLVEHRVAGPDHVKQDAEPGAVPWTVGLAAQNWLPKHQSLYPFWEEGNHSGRP